MKRRTFIKKSVIGGGALIAGQNLLSGLAFADNVKITPGRAKPGHGFTVHDVPQGRLIDGSIARFSANSWTENHDVNLNTHSPYKTARGVVPEYISGGVYTVTVINSLGEFDVGEFTVDSDATYGPPSIEPASGSVGTDFTISDPQGRIQNGDLALFYVQGGDPATGTLAENISVPDSTTLNGRVPAGLVGNITYYVAVRPSPTEPSRFDDLPFSVS